MIAGGIGLFTGSTKNVGSNTFADSLDLVFSPGVYAVAFDMLSAGAPGSMHSGVTMTIEVHGAGGLLATYSPVIDGIGFFGVSSDADAITRINIFSGSSGAEFVDNIAFGSATSEVPEPASILLTAAGGVLLLALRKRIAR